MKDRKTAGQVSLELSQQEEVATAAEITQAQAADYIATLRATAEEFKKVAQGDFWIEVATTRDKILHKTLRNRMFGRHSCPTPMMGHQVYKYCAATDDIKFLWTVPDKQTVQFIMENIKDVPESDRPLIDNILNYQSGALMKQCLEENKELPA